VLVASVGGYVLVEVEIRGLSGIFLVLRWWVGMCLYTRVHSHKLLEYLM